MRYVIQVNTAAEDAFVGATHYREDAIKHAADVARDLIARDNMYMNFEVYVQDTVEEKKVFSIVVTFDKS